MLTEIGLVWFFGVTIPGWLLYVVVLLALFYNRKTVPFDSSFFILWTNLGIIDILVPFNAWPFLNANTISVWPATMWGYQQVSMYKVVAVPISWYLEQGQYAGIVILTLNRFTSVVYPIKHLSLWTGKWLKIALAAPWTIALILPAAHFAYNYPLPSPLLIESLNNTFAQLFSLYVGIFECGIIITAWKLYSHRQKKIGIVDKTTNGKSMTQFSTGNTVAATARMKVKTRMAVEMKMILNILFMTVAMFVKSAFFLMLLYGSPDRTTAFTMNLFLTDIFSLSNPIFLLFCSEHARKMLADFVLRQSKYSM